MESALLILAVALGPSIIVFCIGCVLAFYRMHRPQPRRSYRVAQDRNAT